MVTTVRAAGGFELRNNIEVLGVVGTPTWNITTPLDGKASITLPAAATPIEVHVAAASAADLSAGIHSDSYLGWGFPVRFSNLTPGTPVIFFEGMDGSPAVSAALRLRTDGDVEVLDAAGAVVTDGQISAPFTAATRHFVEFVWRNNAAGAWMLFVDGVDVTTASATTEDFLNANNNTSEGRWRGPATGDGDVEVGSYYHISDGVALPTPLSDGETAAPWVEVLGFMPQKASAAADAGLTTSDDALTSNQWVNAGEWPFSSTTRAVYTTTADGAVAFDVAPAAGWPPEGPASQTDYEISTIHFASWKWVGNRQGGAGADQIAWYGNDADTPIAQHGTALALPNGAPGALREVAASGATTVPLATEHFAMGFEATGTRGFECSAMIAYLVQSRSETIDPAPFLPAVMTGMRVDPPDEAQALVGNASGVSLVLPRDLSPAFGWFRRLAEPLFDVEPVEPGVAAMVLPADLSPDYGWYRLAEQPPADVDPSPEGVAAMVLPADLSPEFGWHRLAEQPLFDLHQIEPGLVAFVADVVAVVVADFGWWQQAGEPVEAVIAALQETVFRTVRPDTLAILSGTVEPSTTDAEVVIGADTIILTLVNDDWIEV